MTPTLPIAVDQTLAEIALGHAAASRILHRHRLDFCCGGAMTLEEACNRRALDAGAVAAELSQSCAAPSNDIDWRQRPLPELIEHILLHYHQDHREELPRLLAMAQKVERVHAARSDVPRGLHAHLESVLEAMEGHMQKEEQMLFPMLLSGRGAMARMPVHVMEEEHRDHGEALERTRALCAGFAAPADACGTWKALYLGLEAFEKALMDHIALENHVLFPRGLRG